MSATRKQTTSARRLTPGLICGLLAALVAVAAMAQRPEPLFAAVVGVAFQILFVGFGATTHGFDSFQ